MNNHGLCVRSCKSKLCSTNKTANSEAYNSIAQVLSFGIQLNCLIYTFHFIIENIKNTGTQELRFNKSNIVLLLHQGVLTKSLDFSLTVSVL